MKSSSRPGPWSHLVCCIFAQVCGLMVWSLPPVVVSLHIAQLHGFVSSDLFLHELSSHVSGTGALVATSDVSCVKLLRELKSWRLILLVSHGVLLVAWCVVCFSEEVCQLCDALERADESASMSVTAWCLTLAWQVERRCQQALSAV